MGQMITIIRPDGREIQAEVLSAKPVSPEIAFYELSGGRTLGR